MAPKLHPGERVLYEGHPSWRSILDFYIKGILATALITLIVAFISSLGEGGADEGLVTIVALVGVALTVLAGFVKRVATSYTITDRRLHIKRGIVSRTIQETRLERVQNVNYNQSVIQRLLQIGDVDFDTAAGDDYNFVFSGVADPADVIHMVDRATGVGSPDGLSGAEAEPRG
ncbi:MAG TPA: PH domain-containing protein [Solirubrobacterales bacterium]|nr:PH domain-containing protein [Solirubrobacterales bacterium]